MIFEIITRCTRPENLPIVQKSIHDAWEKTSKYQNGSYRWNVIIDTSVVKTSLLGLPVIDKINKIYYLEGSPGDMGHGLLNQIFDSIDQDNWIYILDDDNEMHIDFFRVILNNAHKFQSAECFIFSQHVGGKDFTGLDIRVAEPENVKVQGIDMGQFLIKMKLVGTKRFVKNTYTADGIFISEIFAENPHKFIFMNEVLCKYNSIQNVPKPSVEKSFMLPRVMVLENSPDLKSKFIADYESTDINVKESSNDDSYKIISSFDPDCILTMGPSYDKYIPLQLLPTNFRQRWIHSNSLDENVGDIAYNCGMNYILNPDHSNLISIATSIYNTKEKLRRTYESLVNQTYSNWEWIMVNDSTDTETVKIANEIASNDPRVYVYDFNNKTNGIIGESKYRAFMMSRGTYVIELDHDDYLLPHALDKTYEAFQKYPDAGFVYSDCAEIDENHNSLTYGEGFSFGYGYYKDEHHLGRVYKVANSANINPLTIRHIVGVPNHLRAWKKSVYFEVGGHNRRLSIADDYELIVRTFLKTKFVKIPICCYLQFYHDSNSQNATRADIQRRVRTITHFYMDKVKNRFDELGVEDWAYRPGEIAWSVPPRNGDEENYVNYIL